MPLANLSPRLSPPAVLGDFIRLPAAFVCVDGRGASRVRGCLLKDGTPDTAAAPGTDLHLERSRTVAAELDVLSGEHRVSVDRDRPVAGRRQIERHVARTSSRQESWLNGTGENSARRRHRELYLERFSVGHPSRQRNRSGWWRRLKQGASGCQHRQREAGGDGPQHDVILTCRRKGRRERGSFFRRGALSLDAPRQSLSPDIGAFPR